MNFSLKLLIVIFTFLACSGPKLVQEEKSTSGVYSIDYALMEDSVYKIETMIYGEGNEIDDPEYPKAKRQFPLTVINDFELDSRSSLTLSTSTYKDDRLLLTVTFDILSISMLANIPNMVALDTSAINENIRTLVAHGHSLDGKSIEIDSIVGEPISLLPAEYTFGKDITTKDLMKGAGKFEWNNQAKMPIGEFRLLDTFTYKKPKPKNPYAEDSKRDVPKPPISKPPISKPQRSKAEMDSIAAKLGIRVVVDSIGKKKMSQQEKEEWIAKRKERKEKLEKDIEERRKKNEEDWNNRITENWDTYTLDSLRYDVAYFTLQGRDYSKSSDSEFEQNRYGSVSYSIKDKIYTSRKVTKITANKAASGIFQGNSVGSMVQEVKIRKVK